MKKEFINYLFIVLGSVLYAMATVVFIFPHELLLGGTSGISVILNEYLSFSPGTILVIINFSLLIAAFAVLGKNMAIKTFVGSALTTVFIGVFEKILANGTMLVSDIFLSSVAGAALIALASGIMFYVESSSGGRDIIALIVRKYSKINIGKALLITDFLIVIIGGLLSGYIILLSSFAGLLIKTFGIDFVIGIIRHNEIKNIK
ncbi:MAG: YitT family protein [Clostridia bacterium]|nr:YitT family protein [Clostridia bacterium]